MWLGTIFFSFNIIFAVLWLAINVFNVKTKKCAKTEKFGFTSTSSVSVVVFNQNRTEIFDYRTGLIFIQIQSIRTSVTCLLVFCSFDMYICLRSQIWSLLFWFRKDENIMEHLLHLYTKYKHGMKALSNIKHLSTLKAMLLCKKDNIYWHDYFVQLSASFDRLSSITCCTLSGRYQLLTYFSWLQLSTNQKRSTSALFCFRVLSRWNKLPMRITTAKTLADFKTVQA